MQVMRGKPVNFNSEEESARAAQILLSKHGNNKQLLDIDIEALKGGLNKPESADVSRRAGGAVGHPVTRNQLSTVQKDATATNPTAVPSAPDSATAPTPAPAPAPVVIKPDIVTSNTPLHPRLLRLKGELLNILYLLPTKKLQWERAPVGLSTPESEAEQASITAAGEKAAQVVLEGAQKTNSSSSSDKPADSADGTKEAVDQPDDQLRVGQKKDDEKNEGEMVVEEPSEDLLRLAEKAAGKARQKLSRQLAQERFIRDVQQSVKPQQLLQLAVVLEEAIPEDYLFSYHKINSNHILALQNSHSNGMSNNNDMDSISEVVVTIAEVARKIFLLDRSIRYDELRGEEAPDNAISSCPFRLRTQFAPRCVVSSRCKKFLCHGDVRCNFLFETQNGSRVPEGHDLFVSVSAAAPVSSTSLPLTARPGVPAPYASHQQHGSQQLPQFQYQRNDLSLRELIKRMRADKKDIDIETVVPYVPGNFEVTSFEWV